MIAAVEDDTTVFPGDPVLDDPAVIELEPARPQRELDLEALDYRRRGFSIRQIAKLQKVHANTAFNRVRRGKKINAREPLKAEGTSLHAELSLLRQLQQALFAPAIRGDLKALGMLLRIMDRRWRLGKFDREEQKEAEILRWQEEQWRLEDLARAANAGATEPSVSPLRLEPDEMWEIISETLPQRAEEIAQIKKEFDTACAERMARMEEDDDEAQPESGAQNVPEAEAEPDVSLLPAWDSDPEMLQGAGLEGPVRQTEPTAASHGWHRPLPMKRRDRAMKARARRERRANRARAQQLQSASA